MTLTLLHLRGPQLLGVFRLTSRHGLSLLANCNNNGQDGPVAIEFQAEQVDSSRQPPSYAMASSRATTSAVSLDNWESLAPLSDTAKASIALITEASSEKQLPARVSTAISQHIVTWS